MWRHRNIASVSRRIAVLASAMSLIIHIALISLGMGRQVPAAPTAGRMSLHHSHDANSHRPGEPIKDSGHIQACCILSKIPGLPPSPTIGPWSSPLATATVVTFVGAFDSTDVPVLAAYPVGARAPPLFV